MATCPTCRAHYDDGVSQCSADGDNLLPDEAFSGVDADLEPGAMVGEYRIDVGFRADRRALDGRLVDRRLREISRS